MDRLEAMRIVVAAVDAGSFSEASRKLRMPLATVSRKVAALERTLRTRLLTRSTRRLTLTDEGTHYVAHCRRILEEVHEAERQVTGEYRDLRGELFVTAPQVFGRLHVLPVITQFLQTNPDVDIRLILSDRLSNLLEERVDVAVRIGELPDSTLRVTRVGSVRWITCASPAYLKRRGTPKDPGDLSAHDCVTFEGLDAADRWRFGSGRTTREVSVRSRLVVSTTEAAIDAAVAGLGITRVLSYQAARAIAGAELMPILRSQDSPPQPVSLLHRGASLEPVKLRAFLDFSASRLRATLGASS